MPFPPPGYLPEPGVEPMSPALAGRFFTSEPPGKPMWAMAGIKLEEEMATHSSILAWRILWTEEPGGLQYIWSQRVGHD